MTWISVDEQLPELDLPVWLACGDNLFIGYRIVGIVGWRWCNCYGSIYWDKIKWSSFDADADDYAPTHWMPLPLPTPPTPSDA